MTKTTRNDPCICGSGKKYKKCCWGNEKQKSFAMRKLSNLTSPDSAYCKSIASLFSNLKNMNKSLKELEEEARNMPPKPPENGEDFSELKKLIAQP